MQSAVKPWRPCCGKCRGERLRELDDERPNADHVVRCDDCGATWDGSTLTAAEIADRPARPGDSSQAEPAPSPTTPGRYPP